MITTDTIAAGRFPKHRFNVNFLGKDKKLDKKKGKYNLSMCKGAVAIKSNFSMKVLSWL